MKEQTETAMKIFTDIYGMPKWEKEEKDGQDYNEIIALWDNELKCYSVDQVRQASYRVVKYRKSMTFPTISHLLSELCDTEKEEEKGDEVQKCLSTLLQRQPPFDDLAIQRTMWKLYQFKYKNYDPEQDKDNL